MIVLLCLLGYAVISIVPNGHTVEPTAIIGNAAGLPFSEGETLTYEVRYHNAEIGESLLTFHGEQDLGTRKVYYITFSTRIPSLKDTEELYADKDTFLPVKVHRNIKKTVGFNDRIEEQYDQENFRVDIKSKSKLRTKNFSIQKGSAIHNAILLVYYYRAKRNLDTNERFKVNLPTLNFEVMFSGTETLKTALGEYEAYVFTSDPPKFKLWLSADEKKIPLKIKNPGTLGYSLVIKSID
jgi:hypothetical protein